MWNRRPDSWRDPNPQAWSDSELDAVLETIRRQPLDVLDSEEELLVVDVERVAVDLVAEWWEATATYSGALLELGGQGRWSPTRR
jgi:hypothetical protein